MVDEIVMRALSGPVSTRYQRAEDFLGDLLQVRRNLLRKSGGPPVGSPDAAEIAPRPAAAAQAVAPPIEPRRIMQHQTPARIRTRELSNGRFCWHCRKPLPARATRCPFCDETQ